MRAMPRNHVSPMARYVLKRLLWGLFLIVIVCALTFVLFRILPSAEPARLRAGHDASPKVIAEIRRDLGLNRSLPEQFWLYLKNLFLHGELGYSYYSGASVGSLIAKRLPATLSLTVGAALIWLAIGIPIGIVSALRRRSRADRASMGIGLLLISAPEYWLGLIVLYLFAADIGQLKVFPGAGAYAGLTADPLKWASSLVLPWLVLAAGFAAIYARVMRSSLIEAMGQDWIRTARAKGLPEHQVVLKHGLRAAITPLMTIFALDVGVLLGGAVLVETVFDIPGIGRLNYEAIVHADFPIIQGTVLLAAVFIILANIAVDIAHAYVDPRVRYS
jgi:peptide/nickel transport system permease protein